MKFVFFSVSVNGENGLGGERADGGGNAPPPPPQNTCVRAGVLLARYLTNQWTEFHQTLVDDVV